MKTSVILLALAAAALSSCTTAYKTGQTPDDVYYSPARPQDEYVRMEKEDDRQYRYEEDFYEDRYLRMKVRNRYQWNDLNDWYYYERWGFGHNYYYGSYYNPYNTWNYYYNPYCSHTVYVNTRFNNSYTKPRVVNLNVYNNTTVSNPKTVYNNPKYNLPGTSNNNNTYTAPQNSNRTNSNTGNILRDIFRGSGNSGSSNNSGHNTSSSSSSSSSSSGSSGSGSSSGSSAPVRRF
ncbi:MAG: hypothetical protein HYZ15_07710 [Sphingobacteriales bacterium]|nr:hypothetical protein [Sphingobacteriales bacterium]